MGIPLAIRPNSILLGKYRVEQVLGRGGMGVVVRARHEQLDEVVAIKLLTEVAVSDVTFTRFVREARAAAKLRSKHVVRVSDVGELDDGMPYMVMELLEGRDLNHIIKQGGPVDAALLAGLIIQVCEALTEAHSIGIVHRDVKSSNLFVTTVDDAPHVKILDFGIAKSPESVDFSLTRTSSMLGTPGYMSPEQLRSSRTVDHRTDIWSLGVVMYEALEGHRPFDATVFSELCLKIGIDPTPEMTRTQPALAAIVMRCLEKNPEARFQSVAELAAAIAPWATDQDSARRDLARMERILRASGSLGGGEPLTPSAPAITPLVGLTNAPTRTAPRPNAPAGPVSHVTSLRPARRGWLIATTAALVIAGGVTVVLATRDTNLDTATGGVTTPVDKAIETKPDDKPVADKPATDTPAVADKPIAEPVVDRPSDKPVADQPVASKPVATKRPVKRPGTTRPKQPGSGSATTTDTPATGSGSAKPKPCDPFTDRRGC